MAGGNNTAEKEIIITDEQKAAAYIVDFNTRYQMEGRTPIRGMYSVDLESVIVNAIKRGVDKETIYNSLFTARDADRSYDPEIVLDVSGRVLRREKEDLEAQKRAFEQEQGRPEEIRDKVYDLQQKENDLRAREESFERVMREMDALVRKKDHDYQSKELALVAVDYLTGSPEGTDFIDVLDRNPGIKQEVFEYLLKEDLVIPVEAIKEAEEPATGPKRRKTRKKRKARPRKRRVKRKSKSVFYDKKETPGVYNLTGDEKRAFKELFKKSPARKQPLYAHQYKEIRDYLEGEARGKELKKKRKRTAKKRKAMKEAGKELKDRSNRALGLDKGRKKTEYPGSVHLADEFDEEAYLSLGYDKVPESRRVVLSKGEQEEYSQKVIELKRIAARKKAKKEGSTEKSGVPGQCHEPHTKSYLLKSNGNLFRAFEALGYTDSLGYEDVGEGKYKVKITEEQMFAIMSKSNELMSVPAQQRTREQKEEEEKSQIRSKVKDKLGFS